MRTWLLQRVSVAVLLLSLYPLRLAAQSPASVPNGEYTIDDFSLSGDAWGDVTSGGIYIGHYGKSRESAWTPPDHCRISLIRFKAGSTPANFTIFVLTECSDVYAVTLTSSSVGGVDVVSATSTEITSPLIEGIGDIAGDDLYCSTTSGIMFVTHDNITWVVDTSGLGTTVEGIVLDSSLNVYVGTSKGIFTQAPSSTNWRLLPGSPVNVNRFFATREDELVASDLSQLMYRSTNRGATWSLDTLGMGNQSLWNMSEDAKGNLYCVTRNYFSSDHLWVQASHRGPWERIDATFPQLGSGPNMQVLTGIISDRNLRVTTAFGSYVSEDSVGLTWSPANAGLPAATISGFYVYPNGRRVISTTLGAFIKDKTDADWSLTLPSPGFQGGFNFNLDNAGSIYATAGSSIYNRPAFYRSTDRGSNWTTDTIGLSQYSNGAQFVDETGSAHLAPFNPPFVNGPAMQILQRKAGMSWVGDSEGYVTRSGDRPGTFISDRHGSLYLTIENATAGNRVLRRPIGGGTWTEVSIASLGKMPTNFTVTREGFLVGGGNSMATSYYDGTKWTRIPDPPEAENLYHSGHPATVDSMNRLWSIYGRALNSNFTPVWVFWTSDLGEHWTKATDSAYDYSSFVSTTDSTYALTTGSGLFVMSSIAAKVAPDSPGENAMSIRPNPSSGPITIDAGSALSMRAEIFDQLGNSVKRIAGTGSFVWDGRDESGILAMNGAYVIRITGLDRQGHPFVDSKKVIVNR